MFVLVGVLLAAQAVAAAPRPVDTHASRVIVHVYRAGILGGLGDNHDILAPISAAWLDEAAPKITLRFDLRQLRVLDPKLAPEKRAEVQQRMLGPEVLDAERFPQATFESTSISQTGSTVAVSGSLQLHGHSRTVSGIATRYADGYRGSLKLRQRDFGIKPISLAGGTIKVKDEVAIEFDVRPAAAP